MFNNTFCCDNVDDYDILSCKMFSIKDVARSNIFLKILEI